MNRFPYTSQVMLKDISNQEAIERLGFTTIDLVDPDICQKLSLLYEKSLGNKVQTNDMMVNHNVLRPHESLEIHREICRILKPSFDSVFRDYAFLASHFAVKKAKSDAPFQLHQDWNVVDETKYYNFQVWIPVGLSYPENGGLCFVPESHNFYDNVRSGSIGMPSIPIEERLFPYLSYLRLLPGEAAVFYSKTFHGSFVNSTPIDRIAVLVNIIQKKSTPLYFHQANGIISSHVISTEYIFNHLPQLEKGCLPDAEVAQEAYVSTRSIHNNISADDIIAKIHYSNSVKRRDLDYEHKILHILKDSELESRVNKDGFAVIDLLDDDTLTLLRKKFEEMFPDRSLYTGAYAGVQVFDFDRRKEMYLFLKETIDECLQNYFKDYCVPLASFYSRKPDRKHSLDWHSDPSYSFSENVDSIYGLWIPLVDVDENRGVLRVIPKGHRLVNKPHFAYLVTRWPLENKRRLLDPYGIAFNLKAGQAILFDNRMIHASHPNMSDTHRDNLIVRVAHQRAKYFNVVTKSNKDAVGTLYRQGSDFLLTDSMTKHNITPQVGEKIGDYYFFDQEITDEYIAKRLSTQAQ